MPEGFETGRPIQEERGRQADGPPETLVSEELLVPASLESDPGFLTPEGEALQPVVLDSGVNDRQEKIAANTSLVSMEDSAGSSILPSISVSDQFLNASEVAGRTLLRAPGKVAGQIYEDATQRPLGLARTTAISGGIGFGATWALRRFPKAGLAVLAGATVVQAGRYAVEAGDFLSDARYASTELQKQSLIDQGSSAIGREGALLVESLPGFVAGGAAATRVFGAPPLYRAAGQYASESWAFRGPGGMKLPRDIVTQEANINMLKLSEALGRNNRWSGVETGRSADLLRLKASRQMTGSAEQLAMRFPDRGGRVLYHTHAPGAGGIPSRADLIATRNVGIIESGNTTTFYVGQAAEYQAALKAGSTAAEFQPSMRALVLDRSRQTATLVESLGSAPELTTSMLTHQRPVDFAAARRVLSSLDITNPSPQLKSLLTGTL